MQFSHFLPRHLDLLCPISSALSSPFLALALYLLNENTFTNAGTSKIEHDLILKAIAGRDQIQPPVVYNPQHICWFNKVGLHVLLYSLQIDLETGGSFFFFLFFFSFLASLVYVF